MFYTGSFHYFPNIRELKVHSCRWKKYKEGKIYIHAHMHTHMHACTQLKGTFRNKQGL